MDGALGGLEALLAAAKYVESQEQENNQKLIEICGSKNSSDEDFESLQQMNSLININQNDSSDEDSESVQQINSIISFQQASTSSSSEYKFYLVEFVDDSAKETLKSIDIVPISWVDVGENKDPISFFPPGPYDEDFVNKVKNCETPSYMWDMYIVNLKGQARTYREALIKLRQLERVPFVFSDNDLPGETQAEKIMTDLMAKKKNEKFEKYSDILSFDDEKLMDFTSNSQENLDSEESTQNFILPPKQKKTEQQKKIKRINDHRSSIATKTAQEYPSSEKTFSAEPVSPLSSSVAATPLTTTPSVASKGVPQPNAAPAAVATAYVCEPGVHPSNDVTPSMVPAFALSNCSSAASVIVTTLPSFSPTPSLTFTFTTPTALSPAALKIVPPVRLPSGPSFRQHTSPLVIQQQQQQRHNIPPYSPPPPQLPSPPSVTAARPVPPQSQPQSQSQPQTQSHQTPLSNTVSTITILPQRTFSDRTAAVADIKRKLSNSGTREVHNKLEKNRRAHLKECFELLKNQVPAIQDEKKPSNLTILRTAIRYVQILRKREEELEGELERLAKEKILNQQRMTTLKKELSAQWDHINFNSLIPPEAVEISKATASAENGVEHRRDYENELDADKMGMSDVDDSLSQVKSKGGGTYYGSSSSSGSCSISPLHISSPDVISTTSDGLPPQIHIVESVAYDKLSSTSGVTPLQFLSTSTLRMITDSEQSMTLIQHNGGDKLTPSESTVLPKMAVHTGNTFTIFSDSFPKVTATNFTSCSNAAATTVPSTKLVTHCQPQFTLGVTPSAVSANYKTVGQPVKSNFSQSTPNIAVTNNSTTERSNSSVLTTVPAHTTVRSLTNHSFVVAQPPSGQMLLTPAPSHLQTNVMPTPLLKTVSKLQPINGHHQLVVKPSMVVVSSSSVSK